MNFYRICILFTIFNLAACGRIAYQEYPVTREIPPIKQAATAKIALQQLGAPYRLGGNDPSGFDCSGLVYYAYKQQGIKIPRSTKTQLRYSKTISRSQLKSGDLIFFNISGNTVSHVGIYIGNNKFVHSPSPGKRVHISTLKNPYWLQRFIRAGRI